MGCEAWGSCLILWEDVGGRDGLPCIDCGVAGAPWGECDADFVEEPEVRRRSICGSDCWTGLGAVMLGE